MFRRLFGTRMRRHAAPRATILPTPGAAIERLEGRQLFAAADIGLVQIASSTLPWMTTRAAGTATSDDGMVSSPTSLAFAAATSTGVVGLTLINANTDQVIGAFSNGATLDLKNTPK